MKNEKKSEMPEKKELTEEEMREKARKFWEEFQKMPYSYDKAGQVSVQQYKGKYKKPDRDSSEDEK